MLQYIVPLAALYDVVAISSIVLEKQFYRTLIAYSGGVRALVVLRVKNLYNCAHFWYFFRLNTLCKATLRLWPRTKFTVISAAPSFWYTDCICTEMFCRRIVLRLYGQIRRGYGINVRKGVYDWSINFTKKSYSPHSLKSPIRLVAYYNNDTNIEDFMFCWVYKMLSK